MKIDFNSIINCLDNYLTKSGQLSINPIEANEVLSNAGLLLDSKDKRGKPLRELLRKGLLPHAYQPRGKGSTWVIPHSDKTLSYQGIENPKINNSVSVKKDIQITQPAKLSLYPLENQLMNSKVFKSAESIDNLVSQNPGLYCIRIADINKLPKPFNAILETRKHNIIYIGIATKSLKKRFLNQELRGNGHGTFFRSLGALLGYRPPKGSLINRENKKNYKFSPADNQKIIKWINNNLIVNWVEFSGDFESIESKLIKKHTPLINLAKNPLFLKELSDLRKKCVLIANEY